MVPAVVQDAVRGTVGFLRRRSQWSMVFYGLVTRSASIFRQAGTTGTPPPEISFVRSVGARPMAFLKGFADVTRRPSFDDFGFVAGRLTAARPDLVVFVPDKYRVYAPLLDEMPESSLPHAQWAYLERAARAAGVEAVDLTTAMIEHSRASLSLGETTYWRDDTHWNRLGEDVAADSLLRALSTSALARCRDAVGSR